MRKMVTNVSYKEGYQSGRTIQWGP